MPRRRTPCGRANPASGRSFAHGSQRSQSRGRHRRHRRPPVRLDRSAGRGARPTRRPRRASPPTPALRGKPIGGREFGIFFEDINHRRRRRPLPRARPEPLVRVQQHRQRLLHRAHGVVARPPRRRRRRRRGRHRLRRSTSATSTTCASPGPPSTAPAPGWPFATPASTPASTSTAGPALRLLVLGPARRHADLPVHVAVEDAAGTTAYAAGRHASTSGRVDALPRRAQGDRHHRPRGASR